jgi:peptidoglycan hydrolase-like protein with peptidoglycan-binding domain
MYADEFGVLRYANDDTQKGEIKHSPILNNSEISVSNKFLNSYDGNFDFTDKINELSENLFIHSYYVSRFFTLQNSSITEYSGLNSPSRIKNPDELNIRVVDSSGNKYLNPDGTNRYQILLERYATNANVAQAQTSFYRIIVILDDADPVGLSLVYDKYEITKDALAKEQFLGFKEIINTQHFYTKVLEETEVMDDSSSERRIYSTQLFSQKENELTNRQFKYAGWKGIVPKKAIQDPRTFQTFNWRLVAKINTDISSVSNIYLNEEKIKVKAAVIYSSSSGDAPYPFVFSNMEMYETNNLNMNFYNPYAEDDNKLSKNHWTVDLDNKENIYRDYDILFWTPIGTITEDQYYKVSHWLQNGTSVFIDCSLLNMGSASENGLQYFGFNYDKIVTESGLIKLNDSFKNGKDSFNGWNMSEFHEENSIADYGIFGRRKQLLSKDGATPNYFPVQLSVFDTSDSWSVLSTKSIASVNEDVLIYRKLFGFTTMSSQATVDLPSVYFSASSIGHFVNDIFSGGIGAPARNAGALNQINQDSATIVPVTEGACKLFQNIISQSIKVRIANSNKFNYESSILWHVSPWRNSWTINGVLKNGKITVLSEQEKLVHKFSTKTEVSTDINANEAQSFFVREIQVNGTSSLSDILTNDMRNISNIGNGIINRDFSNVEFYIECTNTNVGFLNFDSLSSGEYFYSPRINDEVSPYAVYKIKSPALNQIRSSSPVLVDAYSKVVSPEFDFSSIDYPYSVIESSEYRSPIDDSRKIPKDYLEGSQPVKSYDINLAVQYAYNKTSEFNNSYVLNWEVPFATRISGSGSFKGVTPVNQVSNVRQYVSVASMDDSPIQILNDESPFNRYRYSSKIYSRTDILAIDQDTTKNVLNNFHFTNDIGKSERWDEYKVSYRTASSTTSATTTSSAGTTRGGTQDAIDLSYRKGRKLSFRYIDADSCELDGIRLDGKIVSYISSSVYTYGQLASHPIASKWVFYSNDNKVKFFLNIFKEWLIPFARTKLPSDPYAYLKGAGVGFILREFNKAYPTLYEAITETIPSVVDSSSSTTSGASTTARTTAITVKNSYVKYIQYTLNKNGAKLRVDGVYGPKTAAEVVAFQAAKSQSFVDGIVDSETKSVLAIYWLNLKRTNPTAFQRERAASKDADIQAYIDRAVQYSDISNVGKTEYRRISFTGTAGPSSIVDYILVKVPENATQLHSVRVRAGSWASQILDIKVYSNDLSQTRHIVPDVAKIKPIYSRSLNLSIGANGTKEISVPNIVGAKFIMLKVQGGSISGLGPNAEGFSLRNLEMNITTTSSSLVDVPFEENGTFSAAVTGKIKGRININQNGDSYLDLNHSTSTASAVPQITDIYFDSVFVDTENLRSIGAPEVSIPEIDPVGSLAISIPGISQETPLYILEEGINKNPTISYASNDGNINFVLETTNSNKIVLNELPLITQARKTNTEEESNVSVLEFSVYAFKNDLTTNKFFFSAANGESFYSEDFSVVSPIQNYWIKDADDPTVPARQTPSTISALDGLVVLSDSEGRPIGFPNFESIIRSPEGRDISFGLIKLLWGENSAPPTYGLIWQFYNVQTRRFYGNTITYSDYINPETGGPNAFYVGLLAVDADGEKGNGATISNVEADFSYFALPNKIIAPLYSVKSFGRPKIGVYPPPNNLSKFDSWFIGIGYGKFFKEISIPENNYSNYLKNHVGKKLRCTYDTTNLKLNYSNIFGAGYEDVFNEHPIVVADNQIRTRFGSIHSYQNQINKASIDSRYTDANPSLPWLKVRIKNAETNQWEEIDQNEIIDFNKHTGDVFFRREIVPSSPYNIKIDYVTKSPNILLRHVEGREIPLNPFSESGISKPVYIFISPKLVEYFDGMNYINEEEFEDGRVIDWTYDYSTFVAGHENYDPLALHIATINVINKYSFENISIKDLRVKGGGISGSQDAKKLSKENSNILSFADIQSGKGYTYPNGGYVIVRIPKEVKDHFTSEEEIYAIVRGNLTAGVSFDIQDLEGNDWRTI